MMQILECSMLNSVNIYSYRPVMRLKLALGKYNDVSSAEQRGFADRLLNALPTLREHFCSVGRAGGFAERLYEGTYPAHIFEHVLLELQNLCGDSVSYGKARLWQEPDIYQVIAAFSDEFTGRSCAYLALDFLNALYEGRSFSLEKRLAALKEQREERRLGPSAQAIALAAKERGIPIKPVGDDLLIMGYGCRMKKLWSTVSENTSLLASDIAADKQLTIRLLRDYGLPAPRNMVVYSAAETIQAARMLARDGVVVKPLNGSHGRGVSVNISKAEDLKRAFLLARKYSSAVLVEEYIRGRQYRLCVVNNKLVAAAERIPAYVIGDGCHTVRELVQIANADPLRGDGHNRPLSKMIIDEATLEILHKQRLTPGSVAEKNQIVQIKETANISTGGTAVDVTGAVHPVNRLIAERAARLIGLDIAGIDLIADDIALPLDGQNGAIIEINAAPGIRMHHHPSAGKAINVGGEIIDYLFPYGSDGRIPIAAVTGTNGKTTVTRLLAMIFKQAGFDVGMATTEGVYINEECQQRGDCSGPCSAQALLHDKRVQAAVLETARGGIVRGGLGFDECDIGIVTNVTEDHLGQDGIDTLEDLFFIKSLILEVTASHGTAVINADDSFASQLYSRTKAPVVYFSENDNNLLVRRHLTAGGKAVIVRHHKIYLCHGSTEEFLMDVGDIPITLEGLAAHNTQNALAAAAGAYGFGLDKRYIEAGLRRFVNNQGRLKLVEHKGRHICIDYGHNLAGYQAMLAMARRFKPSRLVGVIGVPGDRRDDVIFRVGKIAGKCLDAIYIKEDADLRGRRSGETAAILRRGVLDIGFAAENLQTVLSEGDAVQAALTDSQPGDFIIIFYENYELVSEKVDEYIESMDEDDMEKASVHVESAMLGETSDFTTKNLYS